MKKNLVIFIVMLLVITHFQPLAASANGIESHSPEEVNSLKLLNFNSTYSSLNDEVSLQIAEENNITKEQMILIDQELDALFNDKVSTYASKPGVGAVAGIVGTVIGLGLSVYASGKYAARQCEVRLGLTSKTYKKYRILYRAGVSAVGGPIMALGFDDYFYGV